MTSSAATYKLIFQSSSISMCTIVAIILCLSIGLPIIMVVDGAPANADLEIINTQRCIDFQISHVEAITTFANGSLFLVHDGQYWLLKPREVPLLSTARPVSRILMPSYWETEQLTNGSTTTPATVTVASEQESRRTIDAAVNVRIKAVNGECVNVDQVLFYSWAPNNNSIVSVYENKVLYNTNVSQHEIFQAATSVDWSRKVNAITFWQDMVVIFHNNSYSSVKCEKGRWKEILHKNISTFPGLPQRPLDSVLLKYIYSDEAEQATVYMFYDNEYYECSVTGTDRCEGPYNVMSEFFDVDHYCANSAIAQAAFRSNFLATVFLLAIGMLIISVAVVLIVIIFKPEHVTYFVNGKMRGNHNRDGTSYQALSKDANAVSSTPVPPTVVEFKNTTNGHS